VTKLEKLAVKLATLFRRQRKEWGQFRRQRHAPSQSFSETCQIPLRVRLAALRVPAKRAGDQKVNRTRQSDTSFRSSSVRRRAGTGTVAIIPSKDRARTAS
jgi:hypothetical protein